MDKRQRRGASQPDADGNPIATAVAAALATQEHSFSKQMDIQMKAFQASVNIRLDTFIKESVRDLAELRASVQFSQRELDDLNEHVKTDADLHKKHDQTINRLSADIKKLDDQTDYLEAPK